MHMRILVTEDVIDLDSIPYRGECVCVIAMIRLMQS